MGVCLDSICLVIGVLERLNGVWMGVFLMYQILMCFVYLSSISGCVWCLNSGCLDGCFFDVLVSKWVLNGVWCLNSGKDL